MWAASEGILRSIEVIEFIVKVKSGSRTLGSMERRRSSLRRSLRSVVRSVRSEDRGRSVSVREKFFVVEFKVGIKVGGFVLVKGSVLVVEGAAGAAAIVEELVMT